MGIKYLDDLAEEREALADQVQNIIDAAATEKRDFTDTERASKDDLDKRLGTLDQRIADFVRNQESRDKFADLMGRAQAKRGRVEQAQATAEQRSWGEVFTSSEAFASYPGQGTSHKVDVEARALPHTLVSWADALPRNTVYDLTAPAQANILLPLITQITVSGNGIDYVSYEKVTGGAAVVPEKGLKPSVEWKPVVTSASLDTIAAHTSFTRQLAEDSAAIRSFFDNELRREVIRKVEEEAVAALGAATIPSATGPAGSGMLGAIRAAAATVQAAGYQPNGFLVHSDDLIDLDLAVMQTAGTGPNRTNAFWGLSPVVDPNATKGTVIVGDFRAGVQHYSRSGVQLFLTDSHEGNFRLNILDAIAEVRSKTVVTRPAALAKAAAAAGDAPTTATK